MDFKDTTKEAEFRKKCHDWLDANAPKKDSSKAISGVNDETEYLAEAAKWQKKKYDAILLAVPHDIFLSSGLSSIKESLKPNSVFFDLKGVFPKELSDARL